MVNKLGWIGLIEFKYLKIILYFVKNSFFRIIVYFCLKFFKYIMIKYI